jgi:hypothetical protein
MDNTSLYNIYTIILHIPLGDLAILRITVWHLWFHGSERLNVVIWVVTPCSSKDSLQHFGGTCCPCLSDLSEDIDSIFFHNVGNYLHD